MMRMRWVLVALFAWSASSGAQQSAESEQRTPEEDFATAREYVEKQGDFFSAMPYLRRAADAGITRAQVWLAEYLDYGEENAEAERYFNMAVAKGDAEGRMGLAIMHIAKDVAKPDLAVARKLIEDAAADAYEPAIKALASAYITGGLGIDAEEQRSPKAFSWISRAADLGDVIALEKLEAVYRTGEFGQAMDVAKADSIRARINKMTGVVEKDDGGRRRRR